MKKYCVYDVKEDNINYNFVFFAKKFFEHYDPLLGSDTQDMTTDIMNIYVLFNKYINDIHEPLIMLNKKYCYKINESYFIEDNKDIDTLDYIFNNKGKLEDEINKLKSIFKNKYGHYYIII